MARKSRKNIDNTPLATEDVIKYSAAIYVRLSREEQEVCRNHASFKNQKAFLLDFVEKHPEITIIKNQFDVMFGNAKLYKESQKKAYSRVDLENEIAVLRRKKIDLYEQYKKGIISREQFNDKKVEISDSILDIEHKIPDADVCSDNLSHSADMVVNYGAPNDIGEDFIKYFIKEVKVFNDKRLKITWNFNLNELLTMEENV